MPSTLNKTLGIFCLLVIVFISVLPMAVEYVLARRRQAAEKELNAVGAGAEPGDK